jgi:hypothetical protein
MLGDEMIIMSTVDSTLFTLNPVGSVIWRAADGKTPLSRIVEEDVCAVFDVTTEQAWIDTEEFIAKLVEHGILHLYDHPVLQ